MRSTFSYKAAVTNYATFNAFSSVVFFIIFFFFKKDVIYVEHNSLEATVL